MSDGTEMTDDDILDMDRESKRRTKLQEQARTSKEEEFMNNAASDMKYIYLEDLDIYVYDEAETFIRAMVHYAAKKDYKSLDELIREKIVNEHE